ILGIFIPLLPTTPFLLLSAALYARSSERFYNWLINNKWLGRYIRDYREGRGIPLAAKIVSITLLWITIGYATFYLINPVWFRILLLLIALIVCIHLLFLPTRQR
ncbi:MAG: YbaN family protein, partial [Bacteroidota bacterium]|nr:YbaN family protein [Bacteroidota bacterium]